MSDILISDFSGVIFDFSLVFNKPVIYTDTSSIDTGVFDAYWLDETPWTFRILSDLGIELNDDNIGNIKEVIDKCLEDPSFEEGRNKARDEAWGCIGQGAVKSVDFVMRKYKETVAKSNEAKQNTSAVSNKKTKSAKKSK